MVGLSSGFPIKASNVTKPAIVFIIVNAALWHTYRNDLAKHGVPPLAREAISRCDHAIHYGGH